MILYEPYDPDTADAKDRVAWALCQIIDDDAPLRWTRYRMVADCMASNASLISDLLAIDSHEDRTAEQDAEDFGTGFEVDGKRVAPERVRVYTNSAGSDYASIALRKVQSLSKWLTNYCLIPPDKTSQYEIGKWVQRKATSRMLNRALGKEPDCDHNWVSGDNCHVKNADVCLKCGTIKPHNEPNRTTGDQSCE